MWRMGRRLWLLLWFYGCVVFGVVSDGLSAVADAGSFPVRSRPTKLLLCVLLLCFAWFHATASPTLTADRLFLVVMS